MSFVTRVPTRSGWLPVVPVALTAATAATAVTVLTMGRVGLLTSFGRLTPPAVAQASPELLKVVELAEVLSGTAGAAGAAGAASATGASAASPMHLAHATLLGTQPASPLAERQQMTISGPQGQATVTLDGAPDSWLAAINAVSDRTGVEASLTNDTTRLDNGTLADPFGEGYLLLRGRIPGAVSIFTAGVVNTTGFTTTLSAASGYSA